MLLTVEGDHVPLMPLIDVVGNTGTVPPEQIDNELPMLNVGVIFGVTVTLKFAGTAHAPVAGVKV